MDPHQEYTLPGVMRYLQTEWQRSEREKIQWNLERAEMRSRITKLESENKSLRKSAASHERHAQMLRMRLESSLSTTNGKAVPESVGQDPTDLVPEPVDPVEVEPESQAVSERVAKYAREIRTLLESSGAIPDERIVQPATVDESLVDKNNACKTRLKATLTGFGAQCQGIGFPDDWVVIGGHTGILYLYDLRSPSSAVAVTTIADVGEEITKIVFDWNCDELLVGTRTRLLRYSIVASNRASPMFAQISVADLEVVDIAVGRCVVAVATPQGIEIWDEQAQAQSHTETQMQTQTQTQTLSQPQASAQGEATVQDTTEEATVATSILESDAVSSGSIRSLHNDSWAPSHPVSSIELADISCVTIGEERTGEVSVVVALRLRATLIVFDPFTGREIRRMALPTGAGAVTSIASIDPAFTSAAVGFDTGDLAVMNLHKGIVTSHTSGAHSGPVSSVAVIKSTQLISSGTDGCVSLWSLPSLAWAGRLFTHDTTGGGAWTTSWIDENEARKAITVGAGDAVARVYEI